MKITLTCSYDANGYMPVVIDGEDADDLTNAELRDIMERILRKVTDKDRLVETLANLVSSLGECHAVGIDEQSQDAVYEYTLKID